MANEQLQITVGANVSQAVGNIKKFNSTLSQVPKHSNSATFALTNLSRVAQDAPYGFIGIANNLNPLLESFQRLKAESGSTKNALKALGGSLMGAGGIGLAIGVVSSLLVVFGDRLFGAKKNTEKAKSEVQKYKEALEEYVETLNDVDKAQLRGAQSAQEEAVKLRTLYEATQNANIPLSKRRELVDELQKQYPKYFANIKDETILAGGAASAYRSLSDAILAAAKARAGQDAITDLAKQQLTLEEQKADALAKQITAYERLLVARNRVNKEGSDVVSIGGGLTGASTNTFSSTASEQQRIAQQNYNKALEETNKITQQINANLNRQKKIAESITDVVEKTPDALLDPTGSLPKQVSEKVKEVNKELDKITQVIKVDVIPTIQRPVEPLTPQRQLPTPVDRMTPRFEEENRFANNDLLKKMAEDAEKLSGIISDSVTPAFTGMFDAILAGENPMKSFFDGLIQGVKRLIDQLIQAAIQAAILSLITGGAAGGGLSFGKAFGKVMGFSGVGGFAGGGGFGGGFGTPGMMNRTAGSIGQRGISVQVQGQLVGQGSQLRAVINNANTLSGIIR